MDSSSGEVALDFSPLLKIYKDGHVERLMGSDVVPASYDPTTNVDSKDVVISEEQDISARIFIPKLNDNPNQKLPLLVYFHGGGFCIETPSSPPYHNFLNSLVYKAQIIAVSVHYRRAPEHPVPVAYDDSWAAIQWAASHVNGNGPEEWLNRHADFGKTFFAGDSAGANISHHMGIRVGTHGLPGVHLEGIALVHTYFWGVERIGSEAQKPEHLGMVDKLWLFSCPNSSGSDDPLINPAKDPNLGKLACKRVLLCVAENDLLKDRGWYYKELVEKSGWQGVVEEVMEAKGEGHVFHLFNPTCENAVALLNRIASFINQP
ncbi:probable carboxylesterase 12 [Abrus precatorius]|uniref:Probable carboxylesterase 12 n=1 Tax=Abrus precatorius TaxID=3816 RepID=A0A8B8KUS1_ABRPR|nr:probable carboxylesterase 12 [Abrus precatorius]